MTKFEKIDTEPEYEPLRAMFDGWCSYCGDRIHEGDYIVSEDGRWIHEECS